MKRDILIEYTKAKFCKEILNVISNKVEDDRSLNQSENQTEILA